MTFKRSYFAGLNRTSPYYYRGISLIGQQTSPRSLIFTTPFVDIPTSAVLAVVVHLLPLAELSNTGVRIWHLRMEPDVGCCVEAAFLASLRMDACLSNECPSG